MYTNQGEMTKLRHLNKTGILREKHDFDILVKVKQFKYFSIDQ